MTSQPVQPHGICVNCFRTESEIAIAGGCECMDITKMPGHTNILRQQYATYGNRLLLASGLLLASCLGLLFYITYSFLFQT